MAKTSQFLAVSSHRDLVAEPARSLRSEGLRPAAHGAQLTGAGTHFGRNDQLDSASFRDHPIPRGQSYRVAGSTDLSLAWSVMRHLSGVASAPGFLGVSPLGKNQGADAIPLSNVWLCAV